MIAEIDKYALDALGIPTRTLMERAGKAVANAVRDAVPPGARVAVFAGKGNNGGDGYAAALFLSDDYSVTVYDVFSAGQRSDEGRYFLDAYTAAVGKPVPLTLDGEQLENINSSDCIVDAVFGTGFFGEMPEIARKLAFNFASLSNAKKVAVDVPLGLDSALGRVLRDAAYRADITVALGFIKTGLVSYPAKEYVGKLVYDNIGLHNEGILSHFDFNSYLIDKKLARDLLPERPDNSNKGSFGKLLVITGSESFRGAAYLSLEAALRSGVGYVTYAGDAALCDALLPKLPEAIYKPVSLADDPSAIPTLLELSRRADTILLGSGSSKTDRLLKLTEGLISTFGAPLVLDADAINVISHDPERAKALIRNSLRQVILTPHPLELSRLSGLSVDFIQNNRIEVAMQFARQNKCILVLKGAATLVTDGKELFINSSGSSALAKAGSGDVLAGHLSALVASGIDPLRASALAVYLHGAAADSLSAELSDFGVIPSDLPKEIARQINKL